MAWIWLVSAWSSVAPALPALSRLAAVVSTVFRMPARGDCPELRAGVALARVSSKVAMRVKVSMRLAPLFDSADQCADIGLCLNDPLLQVCGGNLEVGLGVGTGLEVVSCRVVVADGL